MRSNKNRRIVKHIFAVVTAAVLGSQLSIAQWVQQKSGVEEKLTDVVMLDSSTAIAVGVDGSVLKTTDSGGTWLHKEPPIDAMTSWNCASFYDKFYGIVVGKYFVITSTNGGEKWTVTGVPGIGHLVSAACVSPNFMYVGDDSGWVYCSRDSGKSWTSEKISAGPIRSLFAWPGPYIFGLPIYALTPYSLCNKYVFPSGPWKETILSNFQGLGSEAFSGEFCRGGGSGFIVGVWGDLRAAPAIVRKSASDTAWQGAATGILRDGALLDVSAPSANAIYVCGTAGMIYKSTNGGDTWTEAKVPTKRNLFSVYFYDDKQGFAVGDSGTILHTENGGEVIVGVGKESAALPSEFHLEQNYPNPFNPVTVISYQLAVNSFVTVKVFDLLGREVVTLVNQEQPAGNYSMRWDARNFPGGVYFYRLHSSGLIETKKLVLSK